MAMTQINVAEATGPALDWLVAKCEGHKPVFTRHWVTPSHPEDPRRVCVPAPSWVQPFEPSTNWAQGGPIIEREAHNLFKHNGGTQWCCACNVPRDEYTAIVTADGPTPLIAAMRCYVASKLGDTVEAPEELL